ncbi:MAG: zinc ribbon domain-containing protein [Pseudomonadales bacterium]|nr:zinc ribbon domain-containing protein [Pseudomonadales bacterium]
MTGQILPPKQRTALGNALTAATREGELVLQQCQQCAAVQYPPREICYRCLSDQLNWQVAASGGTVLSAVELHHSYEDFFTEKLPWIIASIQLDNGPIVFAHINKNIVQKNTPVRVFAHVDGSGQAVLIAAEKNSDKNHDPALLEQMGFNEILSHKG